MDNNLQNKVINNSSIMHGFMPTVLVQYKDGECYLVGVNQDLKKVSHKAEHPFSSLALKDLAFSSEEAKEIVLNRYKICAQTLQNSTFVYPTGPNEPNWLITLTPIPCVDRDCLFIVSYSIELVDKESSNSWFENHVDRRIQDNLNTADCVISNLHIMLTT